MNNFPLDNHPYLCYIITTLKRKTKMNKDYRYGWASQQGEKHYAIYTGITDDPFQRYMTGYAYQGGYNHSSYSAERVEEFYQEPMPKPTKDFPHYEEYWGKFQEQLQINALAQAASTMEQEEGWTVDLVNVRNAVSTTVASGEEFSSLELFTQWAVACWIKKTNDVDVWTDGISATNCYSKEVYKAALKHLRSTEKADARARTKYLKSKKAQLASELKEV